VRENREVVILNALFVVTKRGNPDFQQISGHIPTELSKSFKIACTIKGVSHSEGLEEAIRLWLQQEKTA
jgi:hypothetical protein